jgi:hypothetical protein
MPEYGDIVYSVKDIYVASLEDNVGGYGTPAYIEYPQDGGYEPEMDTDKIKASGANREALAIQIGSVITLKEASMRDDAVNIIEGESATESGASGNRVKTRHHGGGGEGLPYFGMVQTFNATDGAIYVYGAAKCKAQSKQKFMAEQNKFRVGEMKIDALATPVTGIIEKTVKYENVATVPDFSDPAAFQTFMASIWS